MSSESGDNLLQSNSSDDVDSNDDDDDDLITFQFDSKTITLYYSQLSKYSQNVREKYLYTDILKYFPSELHDFNQKYNINSDNIIIFFQLLQHNFNLDENIVLTYDQCIDLFKISDFLKIDKLPKKTSKL